MLEIFENIKSELDKNKNVEKIQETVYRLIYDILKPFRFTIALLIFLILLTFILNVVNIVVNYNIYSKLSSVTRA